MYGSKYFLDVFGLVNYLNENNIPRSHIISIVYKDCAFCLIYQK